MTSTISSKGQITVPKKVRDRLGFRVGTTVEFEFTDKGVLLRKGHKGLRPVDRVRGLLERTRRTEDVLADLRGPAPEKPAKKR